MFRSLKDFTLIEWLIVAAIAGILLTVVTSSVVHRAERKKECAERGGYMRRVGSDMHVVDGRSYTTSTYECQNAEGKWIPLPIDQ